MNFEGFNEGFNQLGLNGFLLHKVSEDILNDIGLEVNKVQEDFSKAVPFNDQLAGHIQKEYKIKFEKKIADYIKNVAVEYANKNPRLLFNYWHVYQDKTRAPKPENIFYDGEAWINFQKKGEYNPIHSHSGLLSYVIWYQIPFTREDEEEYGRLNNTKSDSNGAFLFVVPGEMDTVVEHNVGVDKRRQGYMAMFPSNLMHMVYPFFSSDEYRITLSGNLFLDMQ